MGRRSSHSLTRLVLLELTAAVTISHVSTEHHQTKMVPTQLVWIRQRRYGWAEEVDDELIFFLVQIEVFGYL
jgi:hypothetical protein